MYKMPALALTDHNTIAGLPSFHKWASVYGIKPISGVEFTLDNHSHITVLAENAKGYENICKLLTVAHDGETLRKEPQVPENELFRHAEGLIVLSGCRRGKIAQLLFQRQHQAARELASYYRTIFSNSFYIELQADDYPHSNWLNQQLTALAEIEKIPIVATSNVHYARELQFPVHDLLSCIRLKCDIRSPHAHRPLNSSRWLHPAEVAEQRFCRYPDAIRNTLAIAERCDVVVKLNQTLFPEFELPVGRNAVHYLRELVFAGASERYPKVTQEIASRLNHELNIIDTLGYADYFLVVWDIVNFARKRNIRCAGRGSAADSAVAFCLHITDVDAAGRGLLFERFMSLERAEKPDIDVDFESARRDEVMEYVYRKYGRDHVSRIATYQTFQGRSAIREVGAALGLPDAVLDMLAKRVPWMAHADRLEGLFDRVPEMKDFKSYQQQLQWLWKLSASIAGFPRHFGMHVGGLVISRVPLYQITSLQPSAKGEWVTPFDKDAVEDVGLVKLDLLSLRTMSAIQGAIVLREKQGKAIDYDQIPFDDDATFEMIGRGDTIGVFQLESPAQRALQARLHPDGLEDIVASVALIRPGPIKGNMVDPFLARRRGDESITYLHPLLEPILGKTYGVVLFQEQVIEIATSIAKFTPGEADALRRVMSHARSGEEMEKIGRVFLEKASLAGVKPDVAATIFSYIQGYASYGFCEAHAAAFAATAYKTAYLVQHYPAEYYASILNQYPMGYYPVHVICAEARRRGIELLALDVNQSTWECTVENGNIRLGFCLLKGFRKSTAEELCQARVEQVFHSVLDCLERVPSICRLTAERMIRVGAFDSLYSSFRKPLLWELPNWIENRTTSDVPLLMSQSNFISDRPIQELSNYEGKPDFSLAAKLADEYNLLGLGVSGHWMSLLRPWAKQSGYLTARDIENCPDNSIVAIAGLIVRPHRPPTKSGKTVVFFTIEDETGFADATMFESIYHESGAVIFTPYGRLLGVEGRIERRDASSRPQIIVSRVWSLTM